MGCKPPLLAGFAALAIRGLFFATVTDPALVVAAQMLDGLTAAVLGAMVPLIIADLTRGTGRLNIAQGMIGTMMGVGASLSPTFAGYMSDTSGSASAFMGLAIIAVLGLAAVLLLMPETRPPMDLCSRRQRGVGEWQARSMSAPAAGPSSRGAACSIPKA
jgi:MFS family permease